MRRPLWILVGLLSHWNWHRMQFATLLIGLISATALWSGVQAINQQARSSYDRAAAMFGGATLWELRQCLMQAETALKGGVSPAPTGAPGVARRHDGLQQGAPVHRVAIVLRIGFGKPGLSGLLGPQLQR